MISEPSTVATQNSTMAASSLTMASSLFTSSMSSSLVVNLTDDVLPTLEEQGMRQQIQNPTAAMIARTAVAQDDNSGDGTTFTALDAGKGLAMPDGVLINGKGPYRYNTTLVLLIKLLAILLASRNRGYNTTQQNFTSLDIHVGQSYSFLVTMDQNASSDYYIVASARFVNESLWQRVTGVAVLRYSNSKGPATGPLPDPPNDFYDKSWSMNQALSIGFVFITPCLFRRSNLNQMADSWDGSSEIGSQSDESFNFERVHLEPIYDAFVCPLTKQVMSQLYRNKFSFPWEVNFW
nr:monocopper oxidase-like protein sku5 [Quercus suber]